MYNFYLHFHDFNIEMVLLLLLNVHRLPTFILAFFPVFCFKLNFNFITLRLFEFEQVTSSPSASKSSSVK